MQLSALAFAGPAPKHHQSRWVTLTDGDLAWRVEPSALFRTQVRPPDRSSSRVNWIPVRGSNHSLAALCFADGISKIFLVSHGLPAQVSSPRDFCFIGAAVRGPSEVVLAGSVEDRLVLLVLNLQAAVQRTIRVSKLGPSCSLPDAEFYGWLPDRQAYLFACDNRLIWIDDRGHVSVPPLRTEKDGISELAIDPSGKYIAIARVRRGGFSSVSMFRGDLTEKLRLGLRIPSDPPWHLTPVSFSPRGSKLLLEGSTDGVDGQLFEYDISTRKLSMLTAGFPEWQFFGGRWINHRQILAIGQPPLPARSPRLMLVDVPTHRTVSRGDLTDSLPSREITPISTLGPIPAGPTFGSPVVGTHCFGVPNKPARPAWR